MKPSRQDIIDGLVEFFLDSFMEDPCGCGDWLAQGDWDVDEFYDGVKELRKT